MFRLTKQIVWCWKYVFRKDLTRACLRGLEMVAANGKCLQLAKEGDRTRYLEELAWIRDN